MARFGNSDSWMKLGFKVAFSLFVVLDSGGYYRQYIVLSGFVVLLLNFFLFKLSALPYFNQTIQDTSVALDALQVYLYFTLLVNIVSVLIIIGDG